MLTKAEAILELSQMDHAFLTPEGVRNIVKPFGFNPKEFLYKAQDTRSQFKGLCIPEGKEGDWWEGADAHLVAEKLCNKLGVEYSEMGGRGSALRECCERLTEYLSK